MTLKDKLILFLLSIFTLGIYLIVINKKKKTKVADELSVNKKITIDIDKLKKYLGGDENLLGQEYTHTKVKVFFKDKDKVDLSKVEELKGISGVVLGSKYITIIVGNQAKLVANNL